MSNTAANPSGVSLMPTGDVPLTNISGMQQQFVVWSSVAGLPAQSLAAWNKYLASIPPGQTVL